MHFNVKLNLLMNVQNITNSRLAKALSVDPSLISRWRTGSRIPTKNGEYIKAISSYFGAHAKMDYQKVALFEIMGLSFEKNHSEPSSLSEVINTWLCNEASPETKLVNGFLDKLNMFGRSKAPLPQIDTNTTCPSGLQLKAEVFHGIDGKRNGVILFLSAVVAQKKPCTILLYSDESMEWLTEDKAFYMKWGALLMDVILKGNRIKIIHTINRDLSELLSAIDRWLPLYMTGAIEPYYYPKYREHIFRRTMFIATDVAALTSTTLSEHSKNSEQFFYVDQNMIANLAEEFNAYLNMCRPLMQIFTGDNIHKFSELQIEFEEQQGDYISYSNMLSSVTMPQSLLCRLLDKTDANEKLKETLIAMQRKRFKALEAILQHNKYSEIVTLLTLEELSSNATLLKPNDFFGEVTLSYSSLDYCEHIENIIHLLEKHKNYSFIIAKQSVAQNIYLATKEDVGVIVAKNDAAPTIFAFNQQNMTGAFYSYLDDMIKQIPEKERLRKSVIKMLLEFGDG